MAFGRSSAGLIAEKCNDPEIKAKKVAFNWEIKQDQSIFVIIDKGKGFDVKSQIEKLKNPEKNNLKGRGIKIAASFSHKLKYNSKGNQVSLIVSHDNAVEHEVPVGFSKEKIFYVKDRDVVLKEGEPSDYLYYISSGTYEVFHKEKLVGTLSPQDIFMGEMSFLLSQRRSATIRATSDGKLVPLTKKTLINVIREYPHYGIFLSKLLAKRLVRSNEQIASRPSSSP